MKNKRIVYMGSGDIAVPTLLRLAASSYEMVAVYTQPPRKAGRGLLETLTPVHRAALDLQIPVLTPENWQDKTNLQDFRKHKADAVLVFAYGLLLPICLLDILPHRFLNLHASLLPKLRGAAPIERAIEQGFSSTAISFMEMVADLDAGPVLTSWELPIKPNTSSLELSHQLKKLAASNIMDALDRFFLRQLTPTPQNHADATYAPKISNNEATIDFHMTAENIVQKCLALGASIGCSININHQRVKVWEAKVITTPSSFHAPPIPPGTIIDHKNFAISCGESSTIQLLLVQRAGKKIVPAKNFLQQFQPMPTNLM